MNFFDDFKLAAKSLASIAVSLAQIAAALTGGRATGIGVDLGKPHDRPPQKETTMSKPKVSLTKSGHGARAAMAPAKQAKAGDAPQDFVLLDTQDDSIEIFGTNSAGDRLDISGVATLAVTSSDPAVVGVDPPAGMKFLSHALKVGSCTLAITATWNDPAAGIGPFSIDFPLNVQTGGVSGLQIVPGTPTVR